MSSYETITTTIAKGPSPAQLVAAYLLHHSEFASFTYDDAHDDGNWAAAAYDAFSVVSSGGQTYITKAGATATDVPGSSAVWETYKHSEWRGRVGHSGDGAQHDLPTVTIYDTLGVQDGIRFDTNEPLERVGLSIRTEGKTYTTSYNKMVAIVNRLKALKNLSIPADTDDDGVSNGSWFIPRVWRTSPIVPLGQEASKSWELFTCNFLLNVRPVAA